MNRFELLLAKHRVDLRSRWLTNDVSLTKFASGNAVLTCCNRLSREEAIVGVAMLLGVLEMGWDGWRFQFQFPQLNDPIQIRRAIASARRDYRQAFKWAANYLITEKMLHDLRREGNDPMELCESECVTPELVGLRMGIFIPPGFAGSVQRVQWCEVMA